jgi:hypothetical protein
MTFGWALATTIDAENPVAGDLRVSGPRLARLSTLQERVAQGCTVVLRWWRGEWFADRKRGMPYIEELLRKGVSEATVRTVIRRELLRVPGVLAVPSMDVAIDRTTRRCTVSRVIVVTTEGAVTLAREENG